MVNLHNLGINHPVEKVKFCDQHREVGYDFVA